MNNRFDQKYLSLSLKNIFFLSAKNTAFKLILWMFFLGVSASIPAEANADFENAALERALKTVPKALRPWVRAEFINQKKSHCVPLADNEKVAICNWPAQLDLHVFEKKGRFLMKVFLYENAKVLLPGSQKRWPLDVKSDGKPSLLFEENGRVYTRLAAGAHELKGHFLWDLAPESLLLPPDIGQVRLHVKGKPQLFVPITDEGTLWLQKRVQETKEKNALSLWVHRKISDGTVANMEIHIELQVSGESREISLGPVLGRGWLPKSIESQLPARVDDDGKITLQVRPGTYQFTLQARKNAVLETLEFFKPQNVEWPQNEVWVFEKAPNIRQVRIEGGASIDPAQTRLPSSWKHLPAYLMSPGVKLSLKQERRGDEFPTPDRLELARTMWIDFSGKGITFDDEIRGEVHRSRRLEMNLPTRLGQVTLGGSDGVDQFITQLESAEKTKVGIELRGQNLNARATSRYEGGLLDVPAVSWNHDFHSVKEKLHLPPGYRLLHVGGVDEVSDTWLKRWTLMEFFLLLITTLVAAKLFGFPWGVLMFLTLLLVIPEEDAPRWIFLFLLAIEALSRVLQKGIPSYLIRSIRAFGLLILVLLAFPFAVQQVRQGMYPSLKHPYQNMNSFRDARSQSQFSSYERKKHRKPSRNTFMKALSAEVDSMPASEPAPAGARGGFMKKDKNKMEKLVRLSTQNALNSLDGFDDLLQNQNAELAQFDPGAQVQTGPGLPSWNWDQVMLTFSGPVKREQKIALYVATPKQNLILGFLRAGLLLLMALCFLRLPGNFWPKFLRAKIPMGAPLIGLLAILLTSNEVQAQNFPPLPLIKDAVKNVKAQLRAQPKCGDHCVSVGSLILRVKQEKIYMTLSVDAQDNRAILLPGRRDLLQVNKVLIDGKRNESLSRSPDGFLRVPLAKGRHLVELYGRLANVSSLNIPLPASLNAHYVSSELEGWSTQSIHEDGKADTVLTLQRDRRQRDEQKEGILEFDSKALPAFSSVSRHLNLGLTWQMKTVVERKSPLGEGITLLLPLLPGEKVVSDGVRVEKGHVKIYLGPYQRSLRFSSILAEKPQLVLTAPSGQAAYFETWHIEVSNLWHLEEKGIPPLLVADNEKTLVKNYAPWPKETLELSLTRPKGVKGQALTVDKARLVLKPGIRATDATLTLTLRASRGENHSIALADGAEVSFLAVDGKKQPIRVEKNTLFFPTLPQKQIVEVRWREPKGIKTVFHTPKLDLGVNGVNAEVTVEVPTDRWVLFLWGPPLGPAVLFWSLLLGLLIAALGLSRLTKSPLKTRHWLLLGLGLSQIHLFIAAFVVFWILLVSWRERKVELSPSLFAFRQFLVVGSTFIAMISLYATIHTGLLGDPDMQITGNGSSRSALNWMQDRLNGSMPDVTLISVPLMVYRLFMLLWALWLAASVIRWLKWTWSSFGLGGYWRTFPSTVKKRPVAIYVNDKENKDHFLATHQNEGRQKEKPMQKEPFAARKEKEAPSTSTSAAAAQALPADASLEMQNENEKSKTKDLENESKDRGSEEK